MATHQITIDISNNPDLVRLVEEVKNAKEPRILEENNKPVVFLIPWMGLFPLHYTVPNEKKIWTHAALLFSIVYVTYVTLNYVVQLGTVIPMTLQGTLDEIRILNQSPHSLLGC